MALEVPQAFYLDVKSKLSKDMVQDTPGTLTRVQANIDDPACNAVLIAAADLLTANDTSVAEQFRRKVFYATGKLAYAAFLNSDAPKELKRRTLLRLAVGGSPVGLANERADSTLRAFEGVAADGYDLHHEFRVPAIQAMEYYSEITQSADIGRLAYCGSGYIIFQLERAWRRARETMIDEICLIELGDITDDDWVQLSQNPDASS